jgi:hypothetical protein
LPNQQAGNLNFNSAMMQRRLVPTWRLNSGFLVSMGMQRRASSRLRGITTAWRAQGSRHSQVDEASSLVTNEAGCLVHIGQLAWERQE